MNLISNIPPPNPVLVESFTQFYKDNLNTLLHSTDREKVKKGLILQYFIGAFPELINFSVAEEGQKEGLINEYNLMKKFDTDVDFGVQHNIERLGKKTGGSKKKKQVHKKKSKKSRML